MKTVQMTLDDSLVEAVERAVQSLGTTRSAFTWDALQAALLRLKEEEMEHRHRTGYERKPIEPGELSDWEDEQVWGDGCSEARSAGTVSAAPTRSAPSSS